MGLKLSEIKMYYGWVIVGVALISMAFWLGTRSSFSVFYVSLLEDFPWNRGESAGVQSMALLTYTILAPLIGWLIDRFGPRRVIVPGIIVCALGLALCSLIQSLLHFYLLYGVFMGAGISCIGIISYSAIIAHWFERKRGLASGIAVSGMGLGTFFMVPLSQYFISTMGWRFTFVLLAGLALIILLPLNGILLRHKPQDLCLFPDGDSEGKVPEVFGNKNGKRDRHQMDWTLGMAMRTKAFWALLAFTFFSIIGIYIVLVHNVRFLVDQGIDKMQAAFVFALGGLISTGFRIFWGWLSDRIGREITFTLGMLCSCIGMASLIFIDITGVKAFVYCFSIFFGMGWGVSAPMFMAVSADLFKGKGFGLIYGVVEGGIGIAGAIGAWIGGFIFDWTKSYQWAFILGILVFLLSCVLIWVAAPRKHHPRRNKM